MFEKVSFYAEIFVYLLNEVYLHSSSFDMKNKCVFSFYIISSIHQEMEELCGHQTVFQHHLENL